MSRKLFLNKRLIATIKDVMKSPVISYLLVSCMSLLLYHFLVIAPISNDKRFEETSIDQRFQLNTLARGYYARLDRETGEVITGTNPLPPKPLEPLVKLPSKGVSVEGNIEYGDLSGTIYNSNPEYAIHRIDLLIKASGPEGESTETRSYAVYTTIEPLTVGEYSIKLFDVKSGASMEILDVSLYGTRRITLTESASR